MTKSLIGKWKFDINYDSMVVVPDTVPGEWHERKKAYPIFIAQLDFKKNEVVVRSLPGKYKGTWVLDGDNLKLILEGLPVMVYRISARSDKKMVLSELKKDSTIDSSKEYFRR